VYIAGSPKRWCPSTGCMASEPRRPKFKTYLYVFKLKKKHKEGSTIYDRKISDHNNLCLIKQIILFEENK